MAKTAKDKIAVIGLGYVGSPLALALARKGGEVVGGDTYDHHIMALHQQTDTNGNVSTGSLESTATKLTSNAQGLASQHRASSIKIAGAANTKIAGVYDPQVSPDVMQSEYGITPVQTLETGTYDGIVLAVAPSEFVDTGVDKIRAPGRPNATVYDLKGVLGRAGADLRP
ncbi:NAD(P)-binding domain-containing protein [Profundibacter sp.]